MSAPNGDVSSAPATSAAPASSEAPAASSAAPTAPAAAPAAAPAPQPAAAAPATTTSSTSSGPAPNTSLYVGELEPTVTEAMLYEIFSMIGPVASIRVCRDAVTRRSLGYAYVNYLNGNDGERALDQLNYSLIKNKPCRIMFSQRDPALRKNGTGNIFLKNLDENIDNKALHDTFAAFGDILSCKVALDEAGLSKGYGFVHFANQESADAAIQAVNGMLLNDKIVYVAHHVPRRERQAKIDEARAQFTNLYVKNIASEVTDDEFEALFKPFGPTTSIALQRDDDGKSKGFGFVNFERHEDANAAVEALNEKDVGGQQLYVSRAQKKGEREEELRKSYEAQKYEKTLKYQGVNLYVKNLEDDMDEDKLQAEFAPFGTITSCKIMRDEKNVSKGFGFVCYSAPDEATKAVTELNGKIVGTKPLYVSLAQRKDVRKQQLEAQLAQRNQIRMSQMAAAGLPGLGGSYGMQQPNAPPMGYYPGQMAPFPQRGPAGMMGGPYGGAPQGMMPPRPGQPGAGMMGPQRGFPQQQMPGFPGAGGPYPPQGYPGAGGLPGGPRGGPMGGMPGGGPMGGRYPPGQPMPMPGQPQQQQGPPQQQQLNAQQSRGAPAAAGRAGPGSAAPQRAPPAKASGGAAAITAAQLANASPPEQKQILGEAIYPRIHDLGQPELAGKITGMLLEMDNSELLNLLEDQSALAVKVQEALDVLAEYNAGGSGSATAAPAASSGEAAAAAPTAAA